MRYDDWEREAIAHWNGKEREIERIAESVAALPEVRLSTSQAAMVTDVVRWQPIGVSTPRGVKLQLINQGAGVATYGVLHAGNTWWTHWAPLPVF